jgi:alpha-amylase/alpha-mannosidase (GH57 family)
MNSKSSVLWVAFLWHMHQPYYKDVKTNQYQMPWVRLHGLKDYFDMVAILDDYPSIRQTFNLVPSLVEQIQDYASNQVYDEHLLLTEKPAKDLTQAEKEKILSSFFNCNQKTMIQPHPRFYQLLGKLNKVKSTGRGEEAYDTKSAVQDFETQDFLDLQVWSNLTWVDPIFKNDPLISYLLKKGKNFTEEDKGRLISKEREILGMILPKYKQLQDKGQIEVTLSPYFHPISPLICDTDTARIALPNIQLPKERFSHPEDLEAQIDFGIRLYEKVFGRRPKGMWPPEGSVSEGIIPKVAKFGIKWIATDEEILYFSTMSSKTGGEKPIARGDGALYKPYKTSAGSTESVEKSKTHLGNELSVIFRDHTLSDLIGFVYSSWNAQDAANDFIGRLHKIRESLPLVVSGANLQTNMPRFLVSVILDGENCWEYYKNDGHDFLSALYTKLSEDKLLRATTVSDFLEGSKEFETLPHLFAGSWINHNFRVWIGHPEDNLAWDFLKMTRDALVEYQKGAQKNPETKEILEKAWKEVYIAEGSDWCWWYGDEHQGPDTDEFDRIFRSHLLYVYELINKEPPEILYQPIAAKFISTYLLAPTGYVRPTIDGKNTNYYEWQQAGVFDCLKAGGTMHRAETQVGKIFFGFDEKNLYFRIDTALSNEKYKSEDYEFILEFIEPPHYKILIKNDKATLFKRINKAEWKLVSSDLNFSFSKIMELSVPIDLLEFSESRSLPAKDWQAGAAGGKEQKGVWFRLIVEREGKEQERWPPVDMIRFDLPTQKGKPIFWGV